MKKPVHIGTFLHKVLFSCREEVQNGILDLWEKWETIVGETIAGDTRPAAFKEKTLIVHVSDSVWIQQLQYLEKDIIQSINSFFNEEMVNDIKFKIGPV
ncbi:MAG: DUF721 domain-containing protein [Desulfosarcina sp.]|nr:DUF721 domain-containing protein [Desulfobacterales bacterium]